MKLLPHSVWNCINNAVFGGKKRIYRIKVNHIEKRVPDSPKKVLVVANKGGIGNAIEATPLVQAIRMLWPSCHLTFASPQGGLFDNWCIPDRIITRPQEIEEETFHHTFAAYLHENLKDWRNHCSLGVSHTLKTWQKKWLFKPERDYYVGMLKHYGFKGITPPCYVTIKEPEIKPADTLFRICIAPCGKNEQIWKHKKWPYYPELVNTLRNQHPNIQICVIGTKEDKVDIEFDDRNILDFRSVYSLSETAWLMKHSDCVVGNDCGPMHIADAVQARGVVIFGPTCIIKNGPQNKLLTIKSDDSCQPCQYSEAIEACSSSDCIKKIKHEKVMQKIEIAIVTGSKKFAYPPK